jgi:hypothetical protein
MEDSMQRILGALAASAPALLALAGVVLIGAIR